MGRPRSPRFGREPKECTGPLQNCGIAGHVDVHNMARYLPRPGHVDTVCVEFLRQAEETANDIPRRVPRLYAGVWSEYRVGVLRMQLTPRVVLGAHCATHSDTHRYYCNVVTLPIQDHFRT